MAKRWETKDPSDVLDFSLDWTDLLDTNDTVSATPAVWTLPSGITKDSQSQTSTVTTLWISGGTSGTDYTVACQIVTTGSRTLNREAVLPVRNL